MLMLLLLEQSLIFEKNRKKKTPVEAFGSIYLKVIFALLNKIIAIYMELSPIYI